MNKRTIELTEDKPNASYYVLADKVPLARFTDLATAYAYAKELKETQGGQAGS